jgi:hypothetical protein
MKTALWGAEDESKRCLTSIFKMARCEKVEEEVEGCEWRAAGAAGLWARWLVPLIEMNLFSFSPNPTTI